METVGVPEQYSKPEVVRSKETVFQDILDTEKETENIRARGEKIYNSFSEETQNEVDEVVLTVSGDENWSWEERNKKTGEVLSSYANKPEVVEVINLFITNWKMEEKVEVLKKEFVPFKAKELNISINQLSNQIDFDKVVNYFVDFKRDGSEEETISFGDVLYLGEMTNKVAEGKLKDENFRFLNGVESNLVVFEEKCNRLGILKGNETNEEKVKDEDLTKDNLLKEADRINKDLVGNYTLSRTYKNRAVFTNNMRGILRMLDYTYYSDSEKNDSQYNPKLLGAIEKRMQKEEKELKMAGNLPQNEEEKKAWVESKRGNWKTILSEIKIEGLTGEDDKKLVITEDKINGFLENNMPTAFLKKVKKIEVSKEKPKEDVDLVVGGDGKDHKTETKIVGRFNSEYDEGGRLALGNILIYEPITIDKNASRNEELIIENGFRDTLTHEIGHGVHGDFSVDEMKEWEEVMKQDETKVTWYVGYSETKSEPTKKREDFCESFMLFVKDPSFLKIISEKRFEYMKKLFETYMDPENLPNFERNLNWNLEFTDAFLEKNGYTKEQFKSSYLSNL